MATETENSEKGYRFRDLFTSLFTRNTTLRDELIDFFNDQEIPIGNEQLQMIQNVVRLVGMDADRVKIPLPKMVSLPVNSSLKETAKTVVKSGHSRIPVYEDKEGKRDYIGLLYAKELIKNISEKNGKFKLADHVRKIQVVPETQSLLSLLRTMRQQKHHLVLTVNEYGDISGLVTLEDILEEIVGDIRDEYDKEKSPIEEVGHRQYQIDGGLALADLNNELTLNFPEEKFNTLAGFVLHELKGDISEGSSIEYGDIKITVHKSSGRQILSVLLEIPPQ